MFCSSSAVRYETATPPLFLLLFFRQHFFFNQSICHAVRFRPRTSWDIVSGALDSTLAFWCVVVVDILEISNTIVALKANIMQIESDPILEPTRNID